MLSPRPSVPSLVLVYAMLSTALFSQVVLSLNSVMSLYVSVSLCSSTDQPPQTSCQIKVAATVSATAIRTRRREAMLLLDMCAVVRARLQLAPAGRADARRRPAGVTGGAVYFLQLPLRRRLERRLMRRAGPTARVAEDA